ANAARLDRGLADIPGLLTPILADGRTHVFHQYTVRVTPDCRLDRDELAQRLAENGVETGVYYPRVVHDYDCYRAHPRVVATAAPEATRAAREVLSLPVHPRLSTNDVDRVIDVVRNVLSE
ncbi:MAG: perosamine synthetase, partial [Actinomycetota bacterium]|nr:perosamine synthetase [Actinomycetota bacterium]